MNIPKEIDNAECKAALLEASARPRLNAVANPMEMGALLWHGLIDIDKGVISVSRKGQSLLAHWHPTAAQPRA